MGFIFRTFKFVFSLVFFWGEGSFSSLFRGNEWIGLLAQTKKHIGNCNRGRFDITADILEASNGGVRKTFLMYRCNLSYKQVKYYLDFLLENELLCLVSGDGDSNHVLFEITDKGKKFLRTYKSLKALVQ